MRESDSIATDDDSKLVCLCQEGSLSAFEELVRRNEKMMINIAYRTIGDYGEACDIVQDAFVAAYKNIKSFKGASKFATWLSAIVINLSRNRIKELRARRFREPVSLDAPLGAGENRTVMDAPSNEPAADVALEKKEIERKVQLCIDRLDDEYREVIVLREIQGFSYEEITETLDVAEGTMKSRLFRARALLKNCLKGFIGAI